MAFRRVVTFALMAVAMGAGGCGPVPAVGPPATVLTGTGSGRSTELQSPASTIPVSAAGSSAETATIASPTPAAPTVPIGDEGARLSVTGSGPFCGPWYEGCSVWLAIRSADWVMPDGWHPDAGDTLFAVDVQLNDGPQQVTGVRRQGQTRLLPGDYRFLVIHGTSPDDEPVGAFYASVACEVRARVGSGTQAVAVTVAFGQPCRLAITTP